MAKNEAKIKFTAETGDFNKQIKQSNDEMGALRAEFKLSEAQMKRTGASVEGLEKQHSILENQLKASESKTEALSKKVEKAVEIFGENSSEVTKLRTQLANAQTAEEKIKESIDKVNKELKENKDNFENATDETEKFDKSLDEAAESSDSLDGKLGKLAVGVAALGTALVAFGKEAIDAFNEVDEGADNVIKATGATGETAAALEESYKNVASSIVGDFGDIGSALGEVNTRFGFTGSEAEEATTQFLKFSEVTGMDSVSAVQAVSRAIESAGLESSDYKSILDSLTTAGQATGISVDTLATSLTANGAVMREMGYDTDTTIAMLAQFEKAGVDSNSVIRGMRTGLAKWSKDGLDAKTEFKNLVEGIKNGSVDAGAAYEAFGSKAGAELVDAIKSGRFEYEDMVAVIEGSEGSLDNTFEGTIDGGYELELAMQNAKMALAEAGGEIGTALTPALKTFSENILPAATKAISAMVEGISSAVGWMKEHKGVTIAIATALGVLVTAITAYNIVQGVKAAMEAANVTTVWALVSAHLAQAAAAMAAIAPYILVVAAIAAVIAIIIVCIKYWDEIVAACKVAWEKLCATLSTWGDWINTNVIQPIVNFFKGLWDGIVNIFKSIIEWVKTNWKSIVLFFINPFAGVFSYLYSNFEGFRNFINNTLKKIGEFFTNLWQSIKSVFSSVGNWFTNIFQKAKDGVLNAWSGVKNFFSKIWTGIKTAFSNVGSWFSNTFNKAKEAILRPIEAAKNKIKSIVDAIKGFFSNLKLKFPSIKMPHFKITGKFSLDPPSVPKLGIEWYSKAMRSPMILNNATIFGQANGRLLGGGEAGSEMIGGTNTVMEMIQSAVDRSMQTMNINALAMAIEDLANRPIALDINGRQFALATAGDSDRVNGMRTRIIERGVLLD